MNSDLLKQEQGGVVKYANLISASTVARARLGPLELGLKYDVSEVVLEILLHTEACRVVCSCFFKSFIPPYATLTSREHSAEGE